MRTLYQAANALEAHMLADLLKQEGLHAQVQGEHLQGAVGELPAGALVRLTIDDEQYTAARAVIERWEATQVAAPGPNGPPVRARRSGLWGFAMGLTGGVLGSWLFVGAPISATELDFNRDGVADEVWTYSLRGMPLRFEADRNFDKKIDHVVRYDSQGLPHEGESDDDFDGRFETRQGYRFNNVETLQTDTDGDGFPDHLTYLVGGVAMKSEFRNPKTGLPLRVEYFRLNKLTHAEVDTNGDGKLDTRVDYSPLGEVTGRTALMR